MEERSSGPDQLTHCDDGSRSAALDIVARFAAKHGWMQHFEPLLGVTILVAPSQESLRQFLIERDELTSGADVNAVLLAAALPGQVVITNERTIAGVRPEYIDMDHGWVRVIAHELVHLLQENIVGNPNSLGPRWFFEGFACVGAGQKLGQDFSALSPSEVIHAVRKIVGRRQYAVFEAAVRFFCSRIPLSTLVDRAGDTDFEGWLSASGT